MSVGVSQGGDGGDAGDGSDGSDGSDGVVDQVDRNPVENEGNTVSAKDSEMTAIDVDTSYTDTNVPEDGSPLDAVVNAEEDQYSGDGEVWEDTALVDRADAAADDAASKKKGKKEKKSKGSSGGEANDVEVASVPKFKKKGKTKAAASLAEESKATTDRSPFSTGQIVGIAVGVFVAFCMLIRIIKWCCCRKKKIRCSKATHFLLQYKGP